MNERLIIFCTNEHHLKKSEILIKKFNANVDSFIISKKKFLNIKNGKKKSASSIINSADIFIFFTLHADDIIFNLYKQIRLQEKKVIVFQETHQISMHGGVVNNIILSPDLIIAASKTERELLLKEVNPKLTKVISFGWIFVEKDKDLESKKKLSGISNKLNLLILSAPQSITFSSHENDQVRHNVINSIQDMHPNEEIKLLPHPNEKINKLKKFLENSMFKKESVSIIKDRNNLSKIIDDARYIYVSNRTQACIDYLPTYKIKMYVIGGDNFIAKDARLYCKRSQKIGLDFYDLTSEAFVSNFMTKNLDYKEDAFETIEREIMLLSPKKITNFRPELFLWNKIRFTDKHAFKGLFSFNSQIIEKIDTRVNEVNVQDFMSNNFGKVHSSVLVLFYIKKITSNKQPNDFEAAKIFNHCVNGWLIQYFPLYIICFKAFLHNQGHLISLDTKINDLISVAEKELCSKSMMLKIILSFIQHRNIIKISFLNSLLQRLLTSFLLRFN